MEGGFGTETLYFDDDKYKHEFEGLTIDDEFIDNTNEIVEKIIEDHAINISYRILWEI